MDPAVRRRAFSDLQQLIKDEAPFVPLYQIDNIYVHNTRPSWTPGTAGVLDMASAKVAV